MAPDEFSQSYISYGRYGRYLRARIKTVHVIYARRPWNLPTPSLWYYFPSFPSFSLTRLTVVECLRLSRFPYRFSTLVVASHAVTTTAALPTRTHIHTRARILRRPSTVRSDTSSVRNAYLFIIIIIIIQKCVMSHIRRSRVLHPPTRW